MKNRAIICTHHKTGTAWMENTFKAVAAALDVPHVMAFEDGASLPSSASIVHLAGARWWRLRRILAPGDRVLHIIRDPRDIVISAMHYHRNSNEKWLHRPDDRFGGKTYAQTLNDLPDDKARMIFEMDYSSGAGIQAICAWKYGQPDCFETKYETLVTDGKEEFKKIVRHLGLVGPEVHTAVKAFLRHSVAQGARHRIGKSVHIRSGAVEQWRAIYDQDLQKAFTDRFPDAVSQLGYEPFSVESKLPA